MAWGTNSYVTLGIKPRWVFGSRPKFQLVIGGIGFSLVILLLFTLPLSSLREFSFPAKKASSYKFAVSSLSEQVCTDPLVAENLDLPRLRTIPNLVHYVWLVKDPAVFTLEFKHFVSFYSAHLYFEPNKIYIHTNAAPEVFARAKKGGDDWTRRILALPYVEYNRVSVPSETRKGVKIKRIEHKTDFVRMEILYKYGGVYLDGDAVPLRSITDLRNSGFANVLGGAVGLSMRHSGFISNGVMLAGPRTTMMDLYIQAAHEHFDGASATASIYLLTDIANRMAAIPNEVLILQPRAFAPMSWELADQKRLFKPQIPLGPQNEARPDHLELFGLDTCREKFEWMAADEQIGRETWEVDFSSSYVLHAFDDDVRRIGGWNHVVDLKYVLSKRSMYAKAVYPAIAHAIEKGAIPLAEAQGQGWGG